MPQLSYVISTLVLIILIIGFIKRRQRKLHITLMSLAFAIDLGLVLAIEIQNHAVEQLVAKDVSAFTLFHAGISLIVLILYCYMAYQGRAIVRGVLNAREKHRQGAIVFAGFRLLNYVTSFYM